MLSFEWKDALRDRFYTAALARDFEAPLDGMLTVQKALDAQDWTALATTEIILHAQLEVEPKPALLWDGAWEVTWVTVRDMGGAFDVALLGIYILVVAQFGSCKLPLLVLTPVPLAFIGILGCHWLFGAPFSATSMIGFIDLASNIAGNLILRTALAALNGAVVILTDPIFQGLAISL